MRTGFRKQIIFLLAITLVMVPFSSVYSFVIHSDECMSGSMHTAMPTTMDHSQSPEKTDHAS
ncbi:MAG: hypothetical protein ABW079_07565, partial [Sedimenticola sp.]